MTGGVRTKGHRTKGHRTKGHKKCHPRTKGHPEKRPPDKRPPRWFFTGEILSRQTMYSLMRQLMRQSDHFFLRAQISVSTQFFATFIVLDDLTLHGYVTDSV